MDQGAASRREQHRSYLARSVMICAYTFERWERLAAAVASVESQLAAGDELIIVIDHNPDLLARAKRTFDRCAVVANESTPGLSGARNTGVATAGNDIVVFLDDDAVALEGWLDRLTAPLQRPGIVGVGGNIAPLWRGGDRPAWFPEEFLWVVGCSYRGLPEVAGPIRNPIGCNMAFLRDAILDVGGFATDLGRRGKTPLGGEETDLAIRVTQATGDSIWLEPEAAVHHHVDGERLTLWYFLRRCSGEGASKAAIARRAGPDAATATERRYLLSLLRGVAERPLHAIGERSWSPLLQAAAILAGIAATGLGFVTAAVQRLVRP